MRTATLMSARWTVSLTTLRNGLFGIRCRKLDGKLVYRHNRQPGKMEAAEQEVNGKQKIGWEIEGDLKQQLSSAFSALSSSDVDKLASQLNAAITLPKVRTAGVEEIPFSLGTAKADGDQKVTIDMKAKKNLSSFSVNFNYQAASFRLA